MASPTNVLMVNNFTLQYTTKPKGNLKLNLKAYGTWHFKSSCFGLSHAVSSSCGRPFQLRRTSIEFIRKGQTISRSGRRPSAIFNIFDRGDFCSIFRPSEQSAMKCRFRGGWRDRFFLWSAWMGLCVFAVLLFRANDIIVIDDGVGSSRWRNRCAVQAWILKIDESIGLTICSLQSSVSNEYTKVNNM